jgi:ribosomal protein S18 acetylase RimI-like enzyme
MIKFRTFCLWLVCISVPCFAFQTLLSQDGYVYELYEPKDEIHESVLAQGEAMYLQTYLNPKLHEGISLEEMGLGHTPFASYEEFIADMFRNDFSSYQYPKNPPRFYLQVRELQSDEIVGVCAILEESPGYYYIDHIGVAKEHRRQKIASTLFQQFIRNVPVTHVSLDTRVFNKNAQVLYEKLGFQKLTTHPVPRKQHIYFHYVFEPEAVVAR